VLGGSVVAQVGFRARCDNQDRSGGALMSDRRPLGPGARCVDAPINRRASPAVSVGRVQRALALLDGPMVAAA
jgi:hypothetical protein